MDKEVRMIEIVSRFQQKERKRKRERKREILVKKERVKQRKLVSDYMANIFRIMFNQIASFIKPFQAPQSWFMSIKSHTCFARKGINFQENFNV